MFRTYAWVIKTCGDGVYRCNLSVFVLAEVGFHTMEDSETTGCDGCRSLSSIHTTSCCLTADKTNVFVINEIVESSDSIGAAAHTGQDNIRKSSLFFQHLFFDLLGDHGLEITYDGRERVRAHNRSQYIMGICNTVCPLTHGLGNGIL